MQSSGVWCRVVNVDVYRRSEKRVDVILRLPHRGEGTKWLSFLDSKVLKSKDTAQSNHHIEDRCVIFRVITAVTMNITVFWDVMTRCSLVDAASIFFSDTPVNVCQIARRNTPSPWEPQPSNIIYNLSVSTCIWKYSTYLSCRKHRWIIVEMIRI
jgi:hypothetical protein